MDASVVAVLPDSVREPAVLRPVAAIDRAEDVDQMCEPVDVDRVAGGEPPPGVEGVQPLVQLRDPVGGRVPVEKLPRVVVT